MGGPVFDGKKPKAYIDSFAIGLKGNQKVEGGEIAGK
jgi:nitrate/nitrite transport system substrate-binding protein